MIEMDLLNWNSLFFLFLDCCIPIFKYNIREKLSNKINKNNEGLNLIVKVR